MIITAIGGEASPAGAERFSRDVLTKRAALIRKLADSEKVILADVSAAWLAELAKGTPQAELLSQVNHPNLRGHQLAAECDHQGARRSRSVSRQAMDCGSLLPLSV